MGFVCQLWPSHVPGEIAGRVFRYYLQAINACKVFRYISQVNISGKFLSLRRGSLVPLPQAMGVFQNPRTQGSVLRTTLSRDGRVWHSISNQ